MVKLINGECLEELRKLAASGVKVDAIICDPPYATTALKWDKLIPLEQLLPLCFEVLKPAGRLIIFGSEPFYSFFIAEALLHKPIYFNWSHELLWIKKNNSNPLMCNQQLLRYHEKVMILNRSRVGTENEKTAAYTYIKELQNKYYADLTNKQLSHIIGNTHGATNHFFTNSLQWTLMPERCYNNFISFTKQIDPTANFKEYAELKQLNLNATKQTYNPYTAVITKTRVRRSKFNLQHVGDTRDYSNNVVVNKTNYPRSYFVCANEYSGRHPTAKPIKLMEHIVKLYTNKHDIVLDFTMGSGSTGRACVNTDRHFIGIELSPEYYEYAVKWLNEPKENEQLSLEKGGEEWNEKDI